MIDSQNTRDQITSDRLGPNASDQIAFCAFHSFLVEVKRMLATYMRRMRKNNLEIRIAGSSCRPQPDVKKKNDQIFNFVLKI